MTFERSGGFHEPADGSENLNLGGSDGAEERLAAGDVIAGRWSDAHQFRVMSGEPQPQAYLWQSHALDGDREENATAAIGKRSGMPKNE
ncbi:hypothetical protein [Rhizobium leguminosarum]|uniref:hypothetical protein n=1 Tax=Rhizobium leguminosarum TaxID=384 RepID=UPI0010400ADB|nr:hypothetical protein [Rhizobium leguminosarum]TBZ06456.1 hypothetical protein E0H38_32570 [Rhizobium leguminosarum bv. viciae]